MPAASVETLSGADIENPFPSIHAGAVAVAGFGEEP